MSHVINSHASTSEKPCIHKAIHALLMHGYATVNMVVLGPQILLPLRDVYFLAPEGAQSGNFVRETLVKRRSKIVQEITRNVANVFSFHAIIAIENSFSMH